MGGGGTFFLIQLGNNALKYLFLLFYCSIPIRGFIRSVPGTVPGIIPVLILPGALPPSFPSSSVIFLNFSYI